MYTKEGYQKILLESIGLEPDDELLEFITDFLDRAPVSEYILSTKISDEEFIEKFSQEEYDFYKSWEELYDEIKEELGDIKE